MLARIEAHVAQRRELTQALLEWATAAKRETGALEADVYEDVRAADIFCLASQWSSRAALQAHLVGPAFGSVLGAVELLADESAVTVTEAMEDAYPSNSLRRLREASRQIER